MDGRIDGDLIVIGDGDLLKNVGPISARNKKIGIPDTKNPIDDFIEAKRESIFIGQRPPAGKKEISIPHVPCSSSDASKVRTIAPPDAPGTMRDPITGLYYLCLAKTPDGQPADPITYPLPDGSTISMPAPARN